MTTTETTASPSAAALLKRMPLTDSERAAAVDIARSMHAIASMLALVQGMTAERGDLVIRTACAVLLATLEETPVGK